ncbi:MAG: hypothetical protein MUF49_28445 [Oculatellaceae cyanobacterium Prado106]|nr:hypothetical protein [Oculatellaceae cyanobacterium Prado106]
MPLSKQVNGYDKLTRGLFPVDGVIDQSRSLSLIEPMNYFVFQVGDRKVSEIVYYGMLIY